MKKVIYILSDEEKNTIEELYEKKIALENLIKITDVENEKLYNKLLKDYGKIMKQYSQWWITMKKEKDWEGENWFIDFATNEVIINELGGE